MSNHLSKFLCADAIVKGIVALALSSCAFDAQEEKMEQWEAQIVFDTKPRTTQPPSDLVAPVAPIASEPNKTKLKIAKKRADLWLAFDDLASEATASYRVSSRPLEIISAPKTTSSESVSDDPPSPCNKENPRLLSSWQRLFRSLSADQKIKINPEISQFLENYQLRKGCTPSESVSTENRILSLINSSELCVRGDTLAAMVPTNKCRMGLIVPLSGPFLSQGKALMDGMRLGFSKAKNRDRAQLDTLAFHSLDSEAVNNDALSAGKSWSKKRVIESQLADLLLIRHSGVVGAMVDKQTELVLREYADELNIPMIFFGPGQRDESLSNSSVYRIFPQPKEIGAQLARQAMKRGFKRIAILEPTANTTKGAFVDGFSAQFKSLGGEITERVNFMSGNFDSMDTVAKHVFQIDPVSRSEDLEKAYLETKAKAEAEGKEFNPRMVALPPKIDFDAILIADDFRSARHLAKVFRFYGVNRLQLLGTPSWRTHELLERYDPLFNGALFVDYVGNYQELPKDLLNLAQTNLGLAGANPAPSNSTSAPTTSTNTAAAEALRSGTFTDPSIIEALDFMLVGYRGGAVLRAAGDQLKMTGLYSPNMKGRARLAVALDRQFVGSSHEAVWPAVAFAVSSNGLSMSTLVNPTF